MIVNQKSVIKFNPSQWFSIIITHLSIPLILLVCGWDFSWWQAWVFFVLFVTAGIGGRIWTEHRHPGILAERFKSLKAQDVKSWDKVIAPLMALSLSFPIVIVAGLDHHFAWSPPFSTLVRIQKDRDHEVCNSGPYRIVRHPGYAGNIWALPGIVLALGSVWTFIPVVIAVIIAVIRTELEDRTLQEELKGYKEYVQRVRYRLIPGIY